MESLQFKRLLFKAAFCVMACDGEVDESEIREMQAIDKQTTYFKDIDLSAELESLVQDLNKQGIEILKTLFKDLKKSDLTITQELLLLEVVLRMIYADNKVDENEITFLRIVRSRLKIPNEIINDRFGVIKYLSGVNKEWINESKIVDLDSLHDWKLPNIETIGDINLPFEEDE